MMKYIVFCLAFLTLSIVQAAVQTDTHTYIVSALDNCVLAIDRKTNQEQIIKVGAHPKQMVIHKGFGYVVCYLSHNVCVIDLKLHSVIEKIPVCPHPTQIALYKGLGYVVSRLSDAIYVIDLEANKVIHNICVPKRLEQIKIHEGFGYLPNSKLNTVSVMDLESLTIICDIPVGEYPHEFAIYEGFGYVVCLLSRNVCVIDLKAHRVIHKISVGKDPQQMTIHEGYGYVVNEGSHNVSVILLIQNPVIYDIHMDNQPNRIKIYKGFGFVESSSSNTVIVIDLKSLKRMTPISKSRYRNIDFSDTHIYSGLEKLCPLPYKGLKLFKHPYTGIEGDISYENGDKNFNEFESAALAKDNETAQLHFDKALACGHKKAFAIAFYAFVKGVWGATMNDKWAAEFCLYSDLNYLSRISHEETYPYDLELKPEALPVAATPVKVKKVKADMAIVSPTR